MFSHTEVSRATTSPLRRLPQRPSVPAELLRRLSGRPLLLPAPHPHFIRGLLLPRRRALREGRHVHPVLQVQWPVRPPQRSLAPAAALALRRHSQVHGLAVWPPCKSAPSFSPQPIPDRVGVRLKSRRQTDGLESQTLLDGLRAWTSGREPQGVFSIVNL